jgi:zinc transport system substrate-binding protein
MVSAIILFRTDVEVKDENQLQIVATLFPQYDFAKHIVGDKANVKLLLNSGVETHNYEPTAKDMIEILDDSDMFLYNGTDLEPWTSSIVANLKETSCDIVNISENVNLITIEDFEENHINSEIVNDESKHSNYDEEIYDEHIWLSPKNAIIMIDNILEELCKIDEENADYYRKNAEEYKNEINQIDSDLRDLVNNSTTKEIAVGGEFAYSYLVDEYGLSFVSVFTNCGEGEDPSISRVKSVIDYINKNNIPVVYYEELSEGTVAKMISEETDAEALVLYSIHNGDKEKDTYVSLMRKNIENLKKGMN